MRNTHLQYEMPISSGLRVMAKAKDFVQIADTDAHADTDADAKGMI